MSLARRVSPIAVTLALLSLATAGHAQKFPSPITGTWKLNLAKSTYSPANLAPKSTTSKYTVTPTSVSVVTDGVDYQGRTTHSEYTAPCDGTDAPWKGTINGQPNPDQDGISVKCLDSNTLHVVNKKGGKATTTLHIVVSKDGKTRNVATSGTNAAGIKVNHHAVYDKQ